MLFLDLQVHGELGTESKHGALSKSHAENVSPLSYPVLPMLHPFMLTNTSAGS